MSPQVKRALGLALILTVQLMLILDMAVVNVALPDIRGDLGFTPSALSWVLNGYTLTFGGLLLLGSRLGDVFGRRRTFMAGPGGVHHRLAPRRPGSHGRAARRGPGAPGRRRRHRGAERAGPAHHVGSRRRGPQQGTRPVQRGVLGRRVDRPAARRRADRLRLVALVAADQRPARHRRAARWSVACVAETDRAARPLRRRRCGHGDRSARRRLVFGFINAPDHGWTSGGTLAAFAVAVVLLGSFAVHQRRTAAPLAPDRSCCAAGCASGRSR